MFEGSQSVVTLSTSPSAPDTHWYQCRLLFSSPVAVNATQTVSGVLDCSANKHSSYDVHMTAKLDGTKITGGNDIALHNQFYHYWGKPAETAR